MSDAQAGTRSKLRVNLFIPETFPLLYADLAAQPAQHRAERIRHLSTIGLLSCKGNFSDVTNAPHDTPSGEPPEQDRIESAATIRGLLDGI